MLSQAATAAEERRARAAEAEERDERAFQQAIELANVSVERDELLQQLAQARTSSVTADRPPLQAERETVRCEHYDVWNLHVTHASCSLQNAKRNGLVQACFSSMFGDLLLPGPTAKFPPQVAQPLHSHFELQEAQAALVGVSSGATRWRSSWQRLARALRRLRSSHLRHRGPGCVVSTLLSNPRMSHSQRALCMIRQVHKRQS